jgi:hypothetical protein
VCRCEFQQVEREYMVDIRFKNKKPGAQENFRARLE